MPRSAIFAGRWWARPTPLRRSPTKGAESIARTYPYPSGYTAYFIELNIFSAAGTPIKVTSGIYLKGNPPTNIQNDLQPLSDVTISEGATLTVPVLATDADAAPTLTYSLAARTSAIVDQRHHEHPATGTIRSPVPFP